MELQEKIHNLKLFPIFKDFTDKDLSELSKNCTEHTFKNKDIIIGKNDSREDVFFIISGQVKIYLLSQLGKEINLAIVGSGETIGEIAPLIHKNRSAFCEAITDVVVLALPGLVYCEILENNSKLAFGVAKYFAERIIKANKHFEETFSLNIKERALLLLKTLSLNLNSKDIYITQEDLSAILSATRPRVTEALKELENEKLILISRNKIHLV